MDVPGMISPMMKRLDIAMRGGRLHLKGYPQNVSIKKLNEADAKELRALTLHFAEISFCRETLREIGQLDLKTQSTLAKALWLSALATYFNCFGSDNARTLLSARKVLKPYAGAQAVFDRYHELREKHLIPADNPYTHAYVGAVVNPASSEKKIADLVSLAVTAFVVEMKHVKQLTQLAEVTLLRIEEQRQKLRNKLIDKYEQKTRDELQALDDLTFAAPA